MLHYLDNKYKVLALMLFFALPFKAQINSSWSLTLFSDADKAYYIADYLKAMRMYETLLPLDSNNSELNFKVGVCKFELRKYRAGSKKNFDKVNALLFPETNYYLGRLNHSLKNYPEAVIYYQKYQKTKGNLEHDMKEINDLIEKAYSARFYDSFYNQRIKIENLGSLINSEYPDYAPVIPEDESFLMYTSRRKNEVWSKFDAYEEFNEDIYVSKKINSQWQVPYLLDTLLNGSSNDACTALSPDGENLLLFKTSKDLLSGDIFESNFENDTWTIPKILNEEISSYSFIEASACYTPDRNTIIFSSNKLKGFGGFDLYMSKKINDTAWSAPLNLGPEINTEYNEDAPFIDATGTYLYFSSEGHKNMGGYDVFKTVFNETGKFVSIENMGAPINSVNDDIFFVITSDGSTAYYSTERSDGYGLQDIYKVTFMDNVSALKAVSIYAVNDKQEIIKNADVVIKENHNADLIKHGKAMGNSGKIVMVINKEKQYLVTIKAPGYKDFSIDDYSFSTTNESKFTLTKSE